MVYFKGILLQIVVIVIAIMTMTSSQRIAYKKPIYGKTNYIKDKRLKVPTLPLLQKTVTLARPPSTTSTTTSTTTTTTTTTTPPSPIILTTTSENVNVDNSAEPTGELLFETVLSSSTPMSSSNEEEQSTTGVLDLPYVSDPTTTTASLHRASEEDTTTSDPSTTTTLSVVTHTNTNSNQPVPCTCGVFLSSQIHNSMSPEKPLILNELDRIYPCNAIGRKQCQTKCLEAIVQHLPNSANIVCATLGKDCHKERAYLFIKNCQNHWWNTNLQAGREYCCKDGTPYRCPLVG